MVVWMVEWSDLELADELVEARVDLMAQLMVDEWVDTTVLRLAELMDA